AINRAAINNLLLQKKGAPASGILPQWLTGYEFMFPVGFDLDRAKQLRSETAALVVIPPIALAYDFSDPVSKLVAERIALDAREAGLVVQPFAEPHVNNRATRSSINADAVLLRLPLPSLDPASALASLLEQMGLQDNMNAVLGATRPEDLLEIEGRTLQTLRAIPIAHVPEAVWLNGNVHNWLQLPNGTWGLDQLWVEGAR